MSLFESGESSGSVSLGGLLASGSASAPAPAPELSDIADLACRGGWPGLLGDEPAAAQLRLRGYLDEISRTDIARVDGIARDPAGVRRLLASVGRNVGTQATLKTLGADIAGGAQTLHPQTVKSYLDALGRLFVTEELPAWRPHLRSRAELRRAPKRYFADPSLAVAALRSNPDRLMGELSYFGLLFESLVLRDLAVYARANDWELSHYRDSSGLEVDVILTSLDYRQWAAVEVKLGGAEPVEQAVRSLRRLRERIDTARMGDPGQADRHHRRRPRIRVPRRDRSSAHHRPRPIADGAASGAEVAVASRVRPLRLRGRAQSALSRASAVMRPGTRRHTFECCGRGLPASDLVPGLGPPASCRRGRGGGGAAAPPAWRARR